jgi:hypothetical protein
LLAEIIFFWVVYIVCFIFMMAFPKVAFELANGSFKRRERARKAEEAEKAAEEKLNAN